MPTHRTTPRLLALSLLTCLVGLATATHAAEPAPSLTLSPAQVAALGVRSQAVDSAAGSGNRYPATVVLPAAQQRLVAAPLPALVTALPVSVGDSVRAGQVVAVLHSAQAGELQRDQLSSASQASLARSNLARDEALFAEGLIPLARLEASRAQASQAQALADERRRTLAASGAPANGTITLTAPMAGVVLERPAVVGQRVDASTPLLRLGTLSPLWLELQVPAEAAAQLRRGDAVALPGQAASGRVIAIAAMVEPGSQNVLVRAELKQPPPQLRVGQLLQAQVQAQGQVQVQAQGQVQVQVQGQVNGSDALALPEAALLAEGAQRQVFVEAAPGRYTLQPVTLVSASAGQALVRGLAPGNRVVVQGMAALKAALVAAPAAATPAPPSATPSAPPSAKPAATPAAKPAASTAAKP